MDIPFTPNLAGYETRLLTLARTRSTPAPKDPCGRQEGSLDGGTAGVANRQQFVDMGGELVRQDGLL